MDVIVAPRNNLFAFEAGCHDGSIVVAQVNCYFVSKQSTTHRLGHFYTFTTIQIVARGVKLARNRILCGKLSQKK